MEQQEQTENSRGKKVSFRPRKSETELKEKLEPLLLANPEALKNCWMAYKSVSEDIRDRKKQEKLAQEASACDWKKIEKLLVDGKRHQQFAATLRQQNKMAQAVGLESRAQQNLERASALYADCTEKNKVSAAAKKCIQSQKLDNYEIPKRGQISKQRTEKLESSLLKVSGWVKKSHQKDASQVLKEIGLQQ